MARKTIETRGFLMHISHYDPMWCGGKDTEEPSDLDVGLELVDAMAEAGLNLLVIDCADGVRYKSHPELKRHYTVPMNHLRKLAKAAKRQGIDVAPKLNFAKSEYHRHDAWMLPHSKHSRWPVTLDKYWKVAGDLIDEVVSACEPEGLFHIGMDEDHSRSLHQYVSAVKTLRRMLKKHRLRPVIWNDSCHFKPTAELQVMADKIRAAEEFLPRDVVHVLWDYKCAHPAIVKRVAAQGFEVWGAPGRSVAKVQAWRRAVLSRGGSGLLLTHWIACTKRNRRALLNVVRKFGPECA